MAAKTIQDLKELPLNTAEDAYAFFAAIENAKKQGVALPPVNHLFFGRVDSGLKFDPYNIRTVYHDNRPLNYYVVTKDRVIRVNRRTAEYEPVASLQEWIREAKCFTQISKIAFFRTYLRLKTLRRLIDAARAIKFSRNRAILSKKLLLAAPAFQNDVMTMHAKSSELQYAVSAKSVVKVAALQIAVGVQMTRGYSTDEFYEKQNEYMKKMGAYNGAVVQFVRDAVAARSKSATASVINLPVVHHRLDATGAANKEAAAKGLRLSQMAQKRLLVNYDSLPELARIADYLLLESSMRQLRGTFCDLYASTRAHKHNSIWRFRVECLVSGEGALFLVPAKETVAETVNAAFQKAGGTLASALTSASVTNAHSGAHQSNATMVRSTLFGDAVVEACQRLILRCVAADYDEAKSKLPSYEILTAASKFVSEWRDVSYRWESVLSSPTSVLDLLEEPEIRGYASRASKYDAELGALHSRAFGSVVVVCDETLQKLRTDLKGVLDTIDSSLKQLIAANFRTLKKEGSIWADKLRIPSFKLESYIKWYLNLQESGDAFDAFSDHVTDLQNLYFLQRELLGKRDLPLPAAPPDLAAVLRDPFHSALKAAQGHHSSTFGRIKELLHEEHHRAIERLQGTQRHLASTFSSEEANEVDLPALGRLEQLREKLARTRSEAKQLDAYGQVLEAEPFNWAEIDVVEEELRNYVELWTVHAEAAKLRHQLDATPVSALNGQDLEDTTVSLFQRAFKAQKSTPGGAADYLVHTLSTEKAKLAAYVELCNPALKEEHWAALFSAASIPTVPVARRTLRTLEMAGLMNAENAAAVQEIVSGAVGVYELERQLQKLESFWAAQTFTVVAYGGRLNAFVIDAVSEVLEVIEEQQITVQTCLSSKRVAPLQSRFVDWERKLTLIHAVLDEWVSVQKTWMYLEFIFTSDDIKRQLPTESLLFSSADRFFSSLMKRCVADPHMAQLCLDGDGITLKKLQKCTHQLECIQKKIDEYLETKRVAFPRFYFLSNDELLSILSDSRNPLAVQPHLQKCFDNIKSLVFADTKTIVAMRSAEGEEVPFTAPVKAIGNVESWLNDVERAMRGTLYDRLAACLGAYSTGRRTAWFFEHPAQCVTTVDQIIWTSDVEGVIAKTSGGAASAWADYQRAFGAQLLETVELVKRPLSALQRTVVCNLIVVDVHCRDVCSELAGTGGSSSSGGGAGATNAEPPQHACSSLLDFGWQKQLRFYYGCPTSTSDTSNDNSSGRVHGGSDCSVRHGAAELPYGYEYLGNQARLVITPLTERAFLTCTAALHMQKGAAPQGPAGTGKTESVKDLGKALARTVVVFNCSDGLDYRMMSQMFAGLAQAGAWACFDEFNRIELEVLSVVAQQMLDITTAITQRQTSITFEGHRIKLHPNFGVFITMNPGYAGRTELPDNLKALFRPVCMMIPNYALIAEIMFYAEGYNKAQTLAAKMIRLYSLASQQLSKQDHYDFGMRAVKSILVLAGRLKRADPDTDEELLLVRAIREANLPKFLVDDRHLFLALLHDFFPGFTEVAAAPASALIRDAALRVLSTAATLTTTPTAASSSAPLQLQPTEGLLFKVQQLFDTLMTRHGLMLVGHTMTGKTTVRNTLAATLTRLGNALTAAATPTAKKRSDRLASESSLHAGNGGDSARSLGSASFAQAATSTGFPQQPQQTLAVAAALRRQLDARCQSYFTATHAIECNPKAISMTELYGDVNPLTREWQDGVFSSTVRKLVKASADAQEGERGGGDDNSNDDDATNRAAAPRHWVVFDGPVDAMWIENLNTVLDDSKMLCLVNGERIRIPDTISLLFEVGDLRVASPATVSRCGMVYVDEECVGDGWTPILHSLSTAAAAESGVGTRWRHDRFMQLCHAVLPTLLAVVRAECAEYIATTNAQLALNLFYLLKAGVQQLCGMIEEDRQEQQMGVAAAASASVTRRTRTSLAGGDAEADGPAAAARRYSRRRSSLAARTSVLLLGDALFDALFVQSCAWGLGGNLTEATRPRFAAAMLSLVRQESLYFPATAEAEHRGVFDYAMDLDSGDWRRWGELVPAFQYNASASYFDLLVPTEQTVVLQYLLRSATATQHHMLINGLTGTGKSLTVSGYLQQVLRTDESTSPTAAFRFTLSAQTTAQALQSTIEMKLARRKGDHEFGAPPGKQMVVAVIDDCNVPQLEQYGAAPPIELLRQMVSQGGFYDRKRLFFKSVLQTMLIACCGEPGGGKNEMTPRFTSKLLCFCAPQLTATSMRAIFSAILRGFFETRNFAAAVTAMVDAVVDSTLEAYQRIAVECLPTPDKTHCTFNLRDVSKVFQGMLQVTPTHCARPRALTQLWSHEASRVFHDRLVDDADRSWWWRCCADVITKHFYHGDHDNQDDGDGAGDASAAAAAASAGGRGADRAPLSQALPDILYGSWAATGAKREYQRMGDAAELQAAAQRHLAEYNAQSTTPMNLIFFDAAVQHLSRICRIISQPRGHALLVGVGGSGRASLCRLAAFMMNMDVQTVHIARNYGIEDFREEVRKALLDCGARGKDVVFLLSDPQLVCGEMLEDVNNLLNSGEVPGMMGAVEMEVIARSCREASMAAGRPDSRSSVYSYFVAQCCERFHLCLCMSPMSGVFRDRLRMFPALVNCTTIDWFSEWPRSALLAVAKATLAASSSRTTTAKDHSASTDGAAAAEAPAQLDALMVFLQESVKAAAGQLYAQHRRRTHVTPTSYLAVLALFSTMERDLRSELVSNAQRYRGGLEQLDRANATIAVLQQQIVEMQPGLAAAAAQVAEQKESLAVEQADADVLREAQAKEEAAAQGLMAEAESIRRECEEGLQQALPALEAAEHALQTLSTKDIQEIKTFTTPPGNVEKTMNAVLLLLGEKEGWASAKVCLGKMDFISRLTEYPRDAITPACIRKLAAFIQDPDFVPDVIEKTSLPCRSMCMWVHAMYTYYFVAKEIAPKRARLAEAETKVAAARTELVAKQAALQQVLDRIAQLQAAAAAAQAKADHFQHEIETAQARLTRADQLISGLASERGRWEAALARLEMQLGCVEGTAAIAAGCVGYLGPFPLDYRDALLARWRAQCTALGIAFDATYSLASMEPENVIQQWSQHSLPRDAYSIQNATILHRSAQCCYMIDPQGQANTFVRRLERSRGRGAAGLLQLKLSSPNFMRQMENAVQKGQAVLLEDVGESLDAALDPILLRQVRRVAGRSVMVLGDREVTYDDRFHLYITTKLANPTLTPELQVKLTVIDFTVTREGLEEQLLADIVGSERASVQQRADRCVISIAALREEIAALEAQVLRQLSEATGDVLDNVELIRALQTSKATSEKIAHELAAVEETSKTINATRDLYRPLAVRGSLLYGVIAQMAKVDPMYEYSLPFFKGLVVSVMTATRRRASSRRSTTTSAITAARAVAAAPSATSRRSSSVAVVSSAANRDDDGADVAASAQRSQRASIVFGSSGVAPEAKEEGEDGEEALVPAEVRARVAMLTEELTWASYRVLCRGLFAPHKLLFSFVLATTLLKSTGAIAEAEWSLFLRGAAGGVGGGGVKLPDLFAEAGGEAGGGGSRRRPSYMSIGTWADFGALCSLDAFAGVLRSFTAAVLDPQQSPSSAPLPGGGDRPLPWGLWFTSTWGAEVLARLPAALAELSLWHRLMALKTLRPNTLPRMARELVVDTLGERYTVAPPFHLGEAFADSTKLTPIIFVLSPGVDPTALFLTFAEERGFGQRKYMLSLGQDQGGRAAQMIRDGQREGAWVYLQNCHVYASWMPELQAIVEAMNPADMHDDFRLWLTSSPAPSFPPVVLQAGLKLTQEPPMGLRGKVLDVLQSNVVAEIWTAAGESGQPPASLPSSPHAGAADGAQEALPPLALQRLVWTLAFLHGTVMERRRFSPLGWNIAYDWGSADFAAGVATIRTALARCSPRDSGGSGEASMALPTTELCYMLGVIDYGGRVTDEWDARGLQVLTRRFFGDDATATAGEGGQDALAVPAFPAGGLPYSGLLELADATLADTAAEQPARFGLHDNATLAVEQQASAQLVQALVTMNAGGAAGATAAEQQQQQEEGDGAGVRETTAAAATAENPIAAVARKLLAQLPAPLPRCDPVARPAAAHSSPEASSGALLAASTHRGSVSSICSSSNTSNGRRKSSTALLADAAPLQTLLSHETDLYNRLLHTMRSSLQELLRALKGEVVVTARLEGLMQRLAFNQVPELWSQVGYLSLKPLASFLDDLLRRVHFMRRWGEAGVPPSFWLSGIFFPQGFVTAILQARSRALRVPIDSLQLRFRVLPPAESTAVMSAVAAHSSSGGGATDTRAPLSLLKPVVGSYVHGLYLEGCGWDATRGGLVESAPGALTVELPVVHFEAVTAAEIALQSASAAAAGGAAEVAAYECPLYKVRTRAGTLSTTGVSTNYVTCLTLPSLDGVSGDHWTLRGVAALCALDD